MTNSNIDTAVFAKVAKFLSRMKNADLDSLTKLWRKLGKANIDLTPIMQSPAKFRNLQAFIEAGYPKIDLTQGVVVQSTLPDSEELTQLILGDDYLPPEKTAEAFGFQYSDAQLEHLAETLPTDLETLLLLKTYGCMLAAGPNVDTDYWGVKTLDGTQPDELNKYWYVKNKEKFARTDFVKAARWMIIRKDSS